MRKLLLAIALTFLVSGVALAKDGNNGSGNGGCGQGQQTDGCGGDPIQGPPGPQGEQGPPGPQGPEGPMGPQGPQGEKGDKGDPGTNGIDGKDGTNGLNGANGKDGAPGKDGKNGVDGKNGANGKDGAKGDKGDPGVPGIPGAKGDKGDKGDTGPAGPAGKDAVLPADLVHQDQFDQFKHRSYSAMSSVMALAGLPQPTDPGKFMISAAAATYHGEQGYAIGVSTVTEDNHVVIKAAFTKDRTQSWGAVIGAGYQF